MTRPLFAAVCALVLWASSAAADVRSQLDEGAAERCPDAEQISARWRLRGIDDARIELHIVAANDRLVGIVRAAPRGQPPAARRLRSRRDGCSALVDALLTSAALLAAPIELPSRPDPKPPTPPEPEPERPPQRTPAATPPPDTSTPIDPFPWRLSLGIRSDVGAAPDASVLGEIGLARRWPAFSVGGALHGGAMPATGVGAGAVSVERYAAAVAGCWHPTAIGLCGFVRAGAVAVRPDGLDGADTVEALVDVGARAAWQLDLGERWGLVADVEVAAPLRALRLRVDDAAAWQASVISVGGGLAIQWAP